LVGKDQEGKDVFLNGRFIGRAEDPVQFTKNVRNARREGNIPKQVSVRYDYTLDNISLSSEVGRVLRALIVVEDGSSKLKDEHLLLVEQDKLSWEDLVEKGLIEYVD